MKSTNRLQETPIVALFKLASPIFIGMIIHVIYHNVDLYYVGKISSTCIASMGFVYPIVFMFFGIANGIGSAITSVIGNKFGASKLNDLKLYERVATSFLLCFGLFFFIIILFFGKKILTFIGVPNNILSQTYLYLLIISMVGFFDSYSVSIRSIYTGLGNSKTPMIIISVGAVLNIFLDPIFIHFYGFIGAAIATSLCRFIVSIIFFIKSKNSIKLINFFRKELLVILKIGIPASLSMIIISSGNMAINYILNHFSINAVAAIQIVTRIEDVFFLFVISIAYASMTLISMYLGAKTYKKIFEISYKTFFINIGTGLLISLLFYNFSVYFINIFTTNIDVIKIANSYFKYISFIYPIIAFGLSVGRLMQGFGTSIPMLIITSLRIVFLGLPLAYIFTFILNKPIEYVWYSMIIASSVSVIIAFVWFYIKLKNIYTISLK